MAFEDLYQEIILDHYRDPHNSASLDAKSDLKVHENPTCGDSIRIDVTVNDEGRVAGVVFDAQGCAISVASASMMSELLKGLSVDEAKNRVDTFLSIMRGDTSGEELDSWGDLAALKGITQFPLRVKCATLSWHALKEQLA